MDAISSDWLDPLELREEIQQLATDLYIGYSDDESWWDRYPGH